jgi:uncharacterized membrane protein YdjX (TVP38/TMEM64 family)
VSLGAAVRWGVALVVVVVAMLAIGSSPAVKDALQASIDWCATSGLLGMAVYGLLYTASTLLVLPAAILTAAAGWAWGVVDGTLIVLGVSLLADWIPFAIARRLGRERVAAAAPNARLLRALDAAFRRHGFMLVGLLRLSPLAPYNVTNYLLGLVPVTTFSYLAASTLGSVPGVLLIVYLGTLVPRSADLAAVGVTQDPLLLGVALAVALATYLAVVLIARSALRRLVTV